MEEMWPPEAPHEENQDAPEPEVPEVPVPQGSSETPLSADAEDVTASQAPEPESAQPDYAQSVQSLQPGDIVRGRVVQISSDSIMVDVGYKSEGIVSLHELSRRPVERADQVVALNDEIECQVLSIDGEEGTLRLSKRRADEARAWTRLKEQFEAGEILELTVQEAVKGGLVVDVGTRGFIPASQVERGYASDLAKYVGMPLRVKIIELDRGKHRVILSRKVVLEEERARSRERIWSTLAEGQILEGTVKSLTDFGAFIDLGGVDGLLHVSEVSWGRINHPSEVLHEGQPVRVQVLRLDRERGRISLGMKQVLPNPWDDADRRYPPGAVVPGKVVRLAAFGAFVELEPGIDGLVHISQLSDRHVSRPDEVVSVGQRVAVKILGVDTVDRRVSLSLSEVDPYTAETVLGTRESDTSEEEPSGA